MSAFLPWLRAHWPAILAVLLLVIPALATGLSKYPKAAGFVTGLRVVGDVLSVVSHADSPGTFKMLGRRSKPPVDPDVTSKGPKTPPAMPSAALALLFAGALLSPGCGVSASQVGADIRSACGGSIASDAIGLLGQVGLILVSGTDVQHKLDDLAATSGVADGIGVVGCAIETWLGDVAKVRGQLTPAVKGGTREAHAWRQRHHQESAGAH